MAERDPLDYLGQPAPVSFNERAGLPIGSVPPAAPGPVGTPVGEGGLGGVASPAASFGGDGSPMGGFPTAFGPGTFVTDPATGIASQAAGRPTTQLSVSGEPGADTETGTELLSILKAIGGAEGGAKQILNLLRDMGLGVDVQTSVLAPSDYSLAGQPSGSVLQNASNFDLASADPSAGSTPIPTDRITLGRQSLNAADLPRALQELPLFMGDTAFPSDLFTLNADAPNFALNPSDFSLSGSGSDAVLNPGDFNLGDTSIDTSVGGGEVGIPYFGAALSIANSVASALQNPSQDMAGAAVRGIIDGIKAISTQGAGAVAGLWNIPQLVFSLVKLFEGGRDERNRADRTREGIELSGETFGPLGDAFAGRADIRDVLAQKVGGASIGDSLASIINHTMQGSRPDIYGLPDPTLLPLQKALEAAGYLGSRVQPGVGVVLNEGQKGRVGGVGEMITAAGGPDRFNSLLRSLTQGITGQRITAPTPAESFYAYGAPTFPVGSTVTQAPPAWLTAQQAQPAPLLSGSATPDMGYAEAMAPVPATLGTRETTISDPANLYTYGDFQGPKFKSATYIDPAYLTALRSVDAAAADRLESFYRAAELSQAAGRESGLQVGGE